MNRFLLSGLLLLTVLFYGQAQELKSPSYSSDISLTIMPGVGFNPYGKALVGLLESCHGVQWNNKVFTGLGSGFAYSFLTKDVFIPVFAEGRYQWCKGVEASPFVSFRMGGNFCTGRISNLFVLNLSSGVKVKRFSFSVGYEFLSGIDKDYLPAGMGTYSWQTTPVTNHGLTIRLAYSLF